MNIKKNSTETATFGGGCFWCTEAVFKRLKGVKTVTSGYSGGKRQDPSYENVSTGSTGHAEVIQLEFDPSVISFDKLLQIFFATHNPTTLNKQGYDVGTQYRSVIFYHDEKQKTQAEDQIKALQKEKMYKDEVITQIIPYEAFYKAEDYHQNYYDTNREYPYCSVVIDPKVKKLIEKFGSDVKDEYL